ncbi:MAG: GatB/YqeY domain-containing protein [Actinomycetota bacterium]
MKVGALKQRLQDDLKAAMRARDELVRSTLRIVLTGVARAEVAGRTQVELTDEQVLSVIRSEMRRRSEAAGIYAAAGRDELAARERAEAAVLAPYLPPEVGDEELGAVVEEEVARQAAAGTTGPRAMGAVIKAVRGRLGPQADGARIAEAVKRALAAGGP